jgi:hypothetical protein
MSMPKIRGLMLAGLAVAGLLTACAESAPPPAPAPPPPAPPPPPAVSLSPRLIEQAAAYHRYMSRAEAIAPSFSDGGAVAESLNVSVAYEPSQLVRGAIAYGAVAALQEPTFVAGVRTFAKDAATRRQVAYELIKDPAYAVGLPGSAAAAGLVIAAVGAEGQKLYDEGRSVKQAAYDIQRDAWSKAEVTSREARLERAKSLSAAAMAGDVAETARLQQATVGATPLGVAAQPASPPYTPSVIRSLAVAALAALGEAGDANLETLLAMTAEPNISSCMTMSKLNLYQCLAVARPHYEDVFCLGQHAMMDTGRCVIRAAGLPEPSEAKFVPSQSSIDRGYNQPEVKKASKKRRK